MSHTKYLMNAQGDFVIVSKYSGQEHIHLSRFVGGPTKMSQGGFLYLNEQTIQSYGKSVSTGLSSREEDGPLILQAIQEGKVAILEDDYAGFFYAGNTKEMVNDPEAVIATLDLLKKYRIFERDL